MKELLSNNGIEYTYFDISEGMENLSSFLKLRDSRPEFEHVKERGKVGLPCVVVNDGEKVLIGRPETILEELKK